MRLCSYFTSALYHKILKLKKTHNTSLPTHKYSILPIYYCSATSKDLYQKFFAVSWHNLSMGHRKELARSVSDQVCLVEAFVILCCYSVLLRRHSDLCRDHSRGAGHREFCSPERHRTARCISLFQLWNLSLLLCLHQRQINNCQQPYEWNTTLNRPEGTQNLGLRKNAQRCQRCLWRLCHDSCPTLNSK